MEHVPVLDPVAGAAGAVDPVELLEPDELATTEGAELAAGAATIGAATEGAAAAEAAGAAEAPPAAAELPPAAAGAVWLSGAAAAVAGDAEPEEAPEAPDAAAGAAGAAPDEPEELEEAPEAPDAAPSAAGAAPDDEDEPEEPEDESVEADVPAAPHLGPVGGVNLGVVAAVSTDDPGFGNLVSSSSGVTQSEVGMFARNMSGNVGVAARSDRIGMYASVSLTAMSRLLEPAMTLIFAQFMYISRLPILLNQVHARV